VEQLLLVVVGGLCAMVGGAVSGWVNYYYGSRRDKHRWEQERQVERERWEREQRQAALERRVDDARERLEACNLVYQSMFAYRVRSGAKELPHAAIAWELFESVIKHWPMLPRKHRHPIIRAMGEWTLTGFSPDAAEELLVELSRILGTSQDEFEQAVKRRDATIEGD